MNRFKRSYDIHVSKQHGIILLLHIPVNNRTQGPKSNISSNNNNNNTNLRLLSVIWILRHECLLRAERQCGEGGKHENEHINTESTYTMFCRWNIVWQTLRNHSNNERNGMKNPQTFVETNEKRLTTFISGKLLGDLLLCRWNIWAKPSEKWGEWVNESATQRAEEMYLLLHHLHFIHREQLPSSAHAEEAKGNRFTMMHPFWIYASVPLLELYCKGGNNFL